MQLATDTREESGVRKTAKFERNDRPTLRGLTRGSLQIKATQSRIPCLLMCTTCPSWIFVLGELGLEA
jgi:hypothetical protein